MTSLRTAIRTACVRGTSTKSSPHSISRSQTIVKYARFVPNDEIKEKNEYNLNIPRYIDSSTPEDLQDIDGHLHGGIPATDVDSMEKYWVLFPGLKDKLFSQLRDGYYRLNIPKEDIRNVVYNDPEFSAYAERIDEAF